MSTAAPLTDTEPRVMAGVTAAPPTVTARVYAAGAGVEDSSSGSS